MHGVAGGVQIGPCEWRGVDGQPQDSCAEPVFPGAFLRYGFQPRVGSHWRRSFILCFFFVLLSFFPFSLLFFL